VELSIGEFVEKLSPTGKVTRPAVSCLIFYSGDLKDHRIFRIGATEMAYPFFVFPGDITTKSQGSDEGEK
jgi:hypothetical protein